MLLERGRMAPDFCLVSSDGNTVRLRDFQGKNYVALIFYPGDATPGCTKHLCAVRDDYAVFQAKDVKVFGINPGTIESHRKFINQHTFPFPLLVDEYRATARAYGCDDWPVVKRMVFVIDPEGKVLNAKCGIPPNNELLEAIPEKKAT